MWKLVVGFLAFAALVLYVMFKSDANIDMSGEKHDVSGGHTETAASVPAPSASLPAEPASAASQ
ncbi:hypothetical protein LZ017_16650 [Pelomonas sp. CA6]|uniref:hypothetical protein n=1 Tax=Pelomonas sp. CA6 TaxID=2907999 RepID=UPI001F4C3E67|nr:hypothetical protein [Pelomonas sp. CA6]MCH7345013.1 hypothetical protein [Pelomonas sp. CA6]